MAADTHLTAFILALSWLFLGGQARFYHEVSFIESPQYSVALPGDSVYFNCRTNLPSSLENITWLHNGQALPWHGRSRDGQLTFKVSTDPQVFRQQEGTYQCVGGAQGSQFQIASLEAKLSIAQLEDFVKVNKIEQIEVYEGNDIIIPCHVPKSVPPAFVQFSHNDAILSEKNLTIFNGDTLFLQNVTRSMSGNYSCIASNHITSERKHSPNLIHLSVDEVTKNEKSRLIHRPRDFYEVKLGEDVYIPCTASGVPKPDILWTKLNVVNGTDLKVQHGILAIVKAQERDAGHYMCTVFNGARRFVRRTSVTVIVPPQFVQEADNYVAFEEGEALTLPCKSTGSPPPLIQWRVNGHGLSERASVNPVTGDLVVPDVKAEDNTGFYQCFVQNSAGQIVSQTFVQVGPDILAAAGDDYDDHGLEEDVQDFDGFVITSPTQPNVTQVSADSVVLQWDLQKPDKEEFKQPVIPVKFFKIQFREFFRGKGRSSWHTLDEVINSDVKAFEILGLHLDRRYRFRLVAVFENNDSKAGPLSRKFKLNSDAENKLEPRPKPPENSPKIIGVLPLGPTSLRIGWILDQAGENVIEGYFIHYKPVVSDEKYKKITILGATSHSFIIDALIPGTEYEMKIQAFNLAGASPFSNATIQTTAPLPPVTSAEVSEEEVTDQDTQNTKEDAEKNDEAIKYLTLGGALAGCLVVSMLLCTVFNFCQRKRRQKEVAKTCAINGHHDVMSEIQDKYNDTAVQISSAHQSFSTDLNSTNAARIITARSSQSFMCAKDNFEMTLLPDPQKRLHDPGKQSVSDSMFSSGHNSADSNSLGQEEYSHEPSRSSWRRDRRIRSQESFI